MVLAYACKRKMARAGIYNCEICHDTSGKSKGGQSYMNLIQHTSGIGAETTYKIICKECSEDLITFLSNVECESKIFLNCVVDPDISIDIECGYALTRETATGELKLVFNPKDQLVHLMKTAKHRMSIVVDLFAPNLNPSPDCKYVTEANLYVREAYKFAKSNVDFVTYKRKLEKALLSVKGLYKLIDDDGDCIDEQCNDNISLADGLIEKSINLVNKAILIEEEKDRSNHKAKFSDVMEELEPVAWHPSRVWDWCFDEEEKVIAGQLWS